MIHNVPGELERVQYAIPFMTHANGINHVFDVVAGHHPAHAKGQTALHCAARAGHSKIVREVCVYPLCVCVTACVKVSTCVCVCVCVYMCGQ